MTLAQEAVKIAGQLETAKIYRMRSTTLSIDPANAVEIVSTYMRLGYKVTRGKWSNVQWVFSW